MSKKIFISLFIVIILGFVFFPKISHAPTEAPSTKISVISSFLPYHLIVGQIGGEKISSSYVIKPGVEPHDYDPKPSEIKSIYQSNLFIYNGANLEPWADKAVGEKTNQKLKVINASSLVTVLTNQNIPDPHIWLDPIRMQTIAQTITDNLSAIDPINQAYFQKNFTQLLTELKTLDAQYQTLKKCQTHRLVTSHEALGYLADRYGFQIDSIQGLSPDFEPTPRQLSDLINKIKTLNIKSILVEDLVSPKYSQTIQEETHVALLPFHTLEGLPQNSINPSYYKLQLENIKSLRQALQCPNQ